MRIRRITLTTAALLGLFSLGASAWAVESETLQAEVPPPPGVEFTPVPLGTLSPVVTLDVPEPIPKSVSGPAELTLPEESQNPMSDGPSAPAFLTAVAGNRTVLLSWYPSEGPKPISGYLIYRGILPDKIDPEPINRKTLTETNFTDSADESRDGPMNRKTYYYRVRAFDGEERLSPASDLAWGTPNGPLLPPAKVEAVSSDSSVQLTWNEPLSTGPSDLSAYNIYRSEISGNYGVALVSVNSSAKNWIEADAVNGQTRYYTVKSLDLQGNLSEASPEVKASPFKGLKSPAKLSAIGLGEDVIRLRWEPSSGGGTHDVAGYNIYRSTGPAVDLSLKPVNKQLVIGRPRFDDEPDASVEPPKKGFTYRYAVVAVDTQGNPSAPAFSGESQAIESLTKISAQDIEIPGVSDTTLSIRGRKTISLGYNWYVTDPANINSGLQQRPEVLQTLQVQLSGKVGRKIKVDVDYNDALTVQEQQKISVVYTGDAQEVFKEFSFGDITMDLSSPRTEFTGVNRSLFGIKAKLETPDRKFRLTAVGAQTKGITESKRIVGGLEQIKTNNKPGIDIRDADFIRYKYYYLSREKAVIEGNESIKPNSVQIYVHRPSPQIAVNAVQVTKPSGQTYQFVPLVPGVQFSVDTETGLVIFNPALDENASVAVAFRKLAADRITETSVGFDAGGNFDFSPGNLVSDYASGVSSDSQHMIQDALANPSTYDSHMSFQYYNLGRSDILYPQNDPDFRLIIYGADQRPRYELDPRSNFSDVVDFDARLGIMRFRSPFPFKKGLSDASELRMDTNYSKVEEVFGGTQEDIYRRNSPQQNFTIHVEYKYRLQNYSLRFNIVRGSEVIMLDGRRLTRDLDYYLDYDSGNLIFNNPALIRDNSVIEATYEYLPFLGNFTSTLWGLRGEYDVNRDLTIGSTFISNSADQPQEVPEVRSTPSSLQVLDADFELRLTRERISDILGGLKSPVAITLRGEAAHTWNSINTFSQSNETGVAMIDGFESVQNISSASMDEKSWAPGSRPAASAAVSDPGLARDDRQFAWVRNVLLEGHDWQQRSQNGENRFRTMLNISYVGHDTPQKWDAVVNPYSPNQPRNLNDYSYFEMYVKVDQDITLHLDVGVVSEDANDNDLMDTESSDGIFSANRDTGIYYAGSGGPRWYPFPFEAPGRYNNPGESHYWGESNNSLNSEDMNSNSVLDRQSSYYRINIPLSAALSNAAVDTKGFYLVQVPLSQAQVYDLTNSRSVVPGDVRFFDDIRHLRLWWSGAATPTGNIWLESMQFTGNKWQIRSDPQASLLGLSVTANTYKLNVNAVNSVAAPSVARWADNPSGYYAYSPNTDFFRVLVESDRDREQALQLEYRLTGLDQTLGRPNFMARKLFSTNGSSVDLADYRDLRVDLMRPHGSLPGEILVLRLGLDDLNYFEYRVLLDSVPADGGWHEVSMALDGSDGARVTVGTPYLRSIRYASLAVLTYNTSLNNDSHLDAGKELLWINNLRVADAPAREGTAYKINTRYELPGGVVLIHDYRELESDFVKAEQQNAPPNRREQVHTLDTRATVLGMPATLKWEERRNATDTLRREDPLYNLNFTLPDEGKQRWEAGLTFNLIPGLNLVSSGSYENARRDYLQGYVLSQLKNLTDPRDLSFDPDNEYRDLNFGQNASFKVPQAIWGLKGDQLQFDWNWQDKVTRYDQPTVFSQSFKDYAYQRRTFRGRYSGTYKLTSNFMITPSYGYTYTDAQGNIGVPSARKPYYSLDANNFTAEFQPQSRVINPSLELKLENTKLLAHPRVTYNFTQTQDYVNNTISTPGSLEFATSLALKDLTGIAGFPSLDFTQKWEVTSMIYPDERAHVNKPLPPAAASNLEYLNGMDPLQSVWWVRVEDIGLSENVNTSYHIENIAYSAFRRSSSNISTQFELPIATGWKARLQPRLTMAQRREMSVPAQVTQARQFAWGSVLGFDKPPIPFLRWYKADSIELRYDSSSDDTFGADERLSQNRGQQTIALSMPGRPLEKLSVTLRWNMQSDVTTNYFLGGSGVGEVRTYSMTPALSANYFLSINRKVKLWDVWPFRGRELKINQSFDLYNDLKGVYVRNRQGLSSNVADVETDTYTLTNRIGWKFLENVSGNFSLEQNLYNNLKEKIRDYYSLRLLVGVEATF